MRDPAALNVDTNSFDFNYLVLVNLLDNYSYREKFRKYQAAQKVVKEAAEEIRFAL